MKKIEIVGLILAFAMLALLIGLGIVIFATENTSLHDAGMLTVIVATVIGAICQLILLISRKLGRQMDEEETYTRCKTTTNEQEEEEG